MVEDGGHVEGKGLGEFDIIARYFAPLATDASALSLRDDAAVLRPAEGLEIVLSCDTVIEGVHFLSDDPPEFDRSQGLAVNLSDLAAKGARPYVYLLALIAPGDAGHSPIGSRLSPRVLALSNGAAASRSPAATRPRRRDLSASPSPRSASCRMATRRSAMAASAATSST